MNAGRRQSSAQRLLFSLTLGGAAIAGACWWLADFEGGRGRLDDSWTAAAEADLATAIPRGADGIPGTRSEVLPDAPEPAAGTDGNTSARPGGRGPRTERELRTAFLEWEAHEPGVLLARVEQRLSTSRPTAEKVAWLQALELTDAAAAIPWFAFACGLPDPATPQGSPVSTFALQRLTSLAPHMHEARAALGRVALDPVGVPIELRRRAASNFAALAKGQELLEFQQGLLAEQDELLRAGVLVTLETRADQQDVEAARALAWLAPGTPPTGSGN